MVRFFVCFSGTKVLFRFQSLPSSLPIRILLFCKDLFHTSLLSVLNDLSLEYSEGKNNNSINILIE